MSISMSKLVRNGTVALAGTVGTLLCVLQTPGANALEFKRNDDSPDAIVTVADDEDDDADPRDDTNSGWSGNSSRSGDATGSRMSRVSRDRDRSRGDLSRDWSRDGKGAKKRDWSQNRTNDRSRNDTR